MQNTNRDRYKNYSQISIQYTTCDVVEKVEGYSLSTEEAGTRRGGHFNQQVIVDVQNHTNYRKLACKEQG